MTKSLKNNKCLFLSDENKTIDLAQSLAPHILKTLVMGFSGDLGTGKTTFIRALLKALGIQSAIKSPTYSIVESYASPPFDIHHFDLYRIEDPVELDFIGLRDYVGENTVCCIEWPEKMGEGLCDFDLNFHFSIKDKGRALQIRADSTRGQALLMDWMGET